MVSTHQSGTPRGQAGRKPSLNLPLDKVSFIILKAREFDAKEGDVDPDEGSEYLLTMPLLGDYLEDGLAQFDEGIVDDADTREGLNGEDEPLGNMRDRPPRQ